MKKIAVILFLILNNLAFCNAQSKVDNIKKLLILLNTDDQINKSMENMAKKFNDILVEKDTLLKQPGYAKKTANLNAKMLKMASEMMFNFKNIELVKIYDNNFTNQEIKEILRFYESLSGKKLKAILPKLQFETSQIFMSKYYPKYMENIKEMVEFEINKNLIIATPK